ncbi:hypothetical protein WICPIJ_000157 [Wickerhamomyces pijperi]|uniref:t-SNARE coiled-coil homology domain-containing protein n=1 Tax=Wickerhamomyces pijperi TaxID=599730 RepID=A0A9P8TT60_WICPI|nr:hypothetical protein WICPIJ_000157 [Wickerhamomyces pijperi]
MSQKLSSLRLLESFIEDLETAIEESNITSSTSVTPSVPQEVQTLSSKILAHLSKDNDGKSYDELISKYNGLVAGYPDLKQYSRIVRSVENTNAVTSQQLATDSGKKSVRFSDNIDVQAFKPYSDTPQAQAQAQPQPQTMTQATPLLQDSHEDPDSENENLVSNSDIFITHQQTQLSQQDSHLQSLSESVSRSHLLSLDIHGELNQHNIMLADLEAQLDQNEVNLQRAQRGLQRFNALVKGNKEWFTIICLFVILILLLVIL